MDPRVDELLHYMRTNYSGFGVGFKEDVWWWRLMPRRARRAATTLGQVVWFPTRRQFYRDQRSAFYRLVHECVHVVDDADEETPFLLEYTMPQWSLLILALCAIAAAWTVGSVPAWVRWPSLALPLFALLPWPSPWRLYLERRAYTMTMWVQQRLRGRVTPGMRRYILQAITGRLYWRMVWSRERAQRIVETMADRVEARWSAWPTGITPLGMAVARIIDKHRGTPWKRST